MVPRVCNESSSVGKNMGHKLTLVESMAHHDDGPETVFDPYDNVTFTQCQLHQAIDPDYLGRASDAVDLCLADERSNGVFSGSLERDITDGKIPGQIFTVPHATDSRCSSAWVSFDSVEELSSDFSVEEKFPLNASVAQATSLSLHRLTAEVLRAYKQMKHVVQQRIYRRYYINWIRFLTQKPSRTAETQTRENDVLCAANPRVALAHSDVRVSAIDVLLMPLPSLTSACGSEHGARDDASSKRTQDELREGYQPILFSSRHVSVTPLCDPATWPTKQPSPMILRSRNTPFLLQDYGRRSSPPKRAVMLLPIFPNITLPLLMDPGCHVTICQPNALK
ncbi:hypothetical protein MOQ_001528 [Trypanosoma cruzi marinkellei]|uniref:Uncharacterized protein n=1 Tax=Trypanosoma cruzi marinkellei TaxID=85056 RepID=K2NG15_TRYCR|nr:hypothetical protein MOQ_001529 [Trypanosoma cruzi marinkellei]EKF38265.1 hypothetical protein MOQ_001528 [Trypanosoma cruzi marinkellei]